MHRLNKSSWLHKGKIMFDYKWNYRIVNLKSENGGDDWYCLREVYYDGDKLTGHTSPCTGSEDMEGMRDVVGMINQAMEHAPLQEEDFKCNQ